jgi:hypothetical protein
VAILYLLWPFGNFVTIRCIFPPFGILSQEKSGIPEYDLAPILRTFKFTTNYNASVVVG